MTVQIALTCNECLQKVKTYEPGELIDESRDVLKLASNENLLGPSPKVVDAIKQRADRIFYYPDTDSVACCRRVADYWGFEPNQVSMGNGAVAFIYDIFTAFMRPGDKVAFPMPSFPMYAICSKTFNFGSSMQICDLTDYRIDLKKLLNVIDDSTHLVFLANPNNPTGTYFTHNELVWFLERINKDKVIVQMDEAYYQFVDAPDYPNTRELLKEYPNIIITRTFAKATGLAGLRIGCAIGHPDVIDVMNKVKYAFNLNQIAQYALIAALDDEPYTQKCVHIIRDLREKMYKRLLDLGLFCPPSQTNFLFVDAKVNGRELYKTMSQLGVTVRPMDGFKGFESYIRVSMPKDESGLDRFFKTLEEGLKIVKASASAG